MFSFSFPKKNSEKVLIVFIVLQVLTAPFPSTAAESNKIWFENLKAPITLSDTDQLALAEFARSSFLIGNNTINVLPAPLNKDTLPRLVFLSVSNGSSSPVVVLASGAGIVPTIKQAASQARNRGKRSDRREWIKLDIVQEVYPVYKFEVSKPLELERSLYGIAFDKRSGMAFLPEELVSYTLINSDQLMRLDNIVERVNQVRDRRYFKTLLKSGNRFTLYRFKTTSIFSDGKQTFPLYRGHRSFSRISKEDLLSAARAGGWYLTHAVDHDGKFIYSYRPKTGAEPEKYNIVRHAGAIYALLELYQVTKEEDLLRAAKKALAYLLRSTKSCQTGDETATCIVEDGYTKLGGNALAAVALAKYNEVTGDRSYVPVLLQLGKWIKNAQKESGEFFIQKQRYPEGTIAGFVSEYYPGEALLALTRLYAIDPDTTWLDTAEKGARYLINTRDQGLSIAELSHDHWLLYALNELYRYRPKQLYLDHALRISRAIIQSQNRKPHYPDWLGSYYIPPRSTPAATRAEGLCAAYQLARDFGRAKEAEEILESIRLGIAFQLQTQFMPESVMYLEDPQLALGGFHRSLTDFEIRIDYVQHNISSLLGFVRVLDRK